MTNKERTANHRRLDVAGLSSSFRRPNTSRQKTQERAAAARNATAVPNEISYFKPGLTSLTEYKTAPMIPNPNALENWMTRISARSSFPLFCSSNTSATFQPSTGVSNGFG